MGLIIRWFTSALALYVVSLILPGVVLSDFISALIAVVVIALVNAFVKPILIFLTLPINFVTLGLFTFIVNALLLMLAAYFSPGFEVDGFFTAIIGSMLLTIISTLLNSFVR